MKLHWIKIGLLSLVLTNGVSAKEQRPNILFIAIDDMKPMTGCYGDKMALTPNIDKLAERSTVFLNNQCNWSVCGPSRVSLMTSLMPDTTGVTGFKKMRAVLPDVLTLPAHLKANGYVTTGVGKIFDHRTVDSKYDARSWSIPFDGMKSSGLKMKGPKKAAAIFEGTMEENKDYLVAQAGIKLLGELSKQDKPFFLGVGFHKPHLPLIAPKKYWDLYKRDQFKIHPFQQHGKDAYPKTFEKPDELSKYTKTPQAETPEAQQKEIIHGYYACVSFIDDLVGDVISELETLGIADNTIIVLWGDHGFHLGDHGLWAKHTNIEQAARSPLIIYAPKVNKKGQKTESPSQFLDVFPTLCELTGSEIPKQLQGKSLVPILKSADASVHNGVITQQGAGSYAYRTKRYRYIEWYNKTGKLLAQNLYDYQNDPQEKVNIAADPANAELVKQIAEKMHEEAKGCSHIK